MRSIPKYCITLLVFLVIFFSTEVFSKPVTQKELTTVSNRFIHTRLNTNLVFLTNQISLKKNSVDGITTDSESNDLGYVVSLAPTGFLILSSDTDMEPVIAYSYRNNWSADTSKANHFYQWLVSDLKARMESLDQLPEKIRLKNNEKWQTYLSSDQNQHVSQVVEQWPPAGSTTTGGWVETTWIQAAPFNNFCPLDPTDYQRCLTGCGATAIAQIVNYHQYFGNKRFSADDHYSNTSPDISIDGDSTLLDFPSFKQLNRYLDTLQFKFDQNLPLDTNNMAALSFAAGLIAYTKYDKSGSAVYNDQVYQAFINEMDYATASLTSPDEMFYDRLKDNMKEGLPAQLSIIGSTAGHALICDGYNTDDFYHLSFGWGDSRPAAITDAWYHMPEGIPYGDVLIYNAVIDIRPGLDSQTNLVLSDTLFKFKPVIIDNLSEAISCKFLNDGLKTLYIDEIILPDYFFAKIGAGQLTQHIDQLALEPGEELVLDLFCKPDSLGKFSGEMEIILSLDNRKRFKYLPLIGFGRGETGTIVTENQVSGVWDKTGSPYYIVDNLAIAPGRQLLIKAGTQIFSEHGCSFEIGPDAQLIAQGVAGDSVYFSATRPDKGWQGLTFYSSGEDDILSYCAISDVQSNSAIQLENTNAMITHSILKNNQSLDGGTINAMNSDFRLSHSTIIANLGTSGGAIYLRESAPIVENSKFIANQATGGGAIYIRDSSPVFSNSEFSQNNARLTGGAIYSTGSDISLKNCVLQSNTAGDAGSIISTRFSTVSIQNISAVNHQLSEFSDLFELSGNNKMEVKNSIFWYNSIITNASDKISLPENHYILLAQNDTIEFHYNDIDSILIKALFREPSGLRSEGTIHWGHQNISVDPLFQDPDNNDFKLKGESPCIDAADPQDAIEDEPFPHGFCRNLGVYGGTEYAQKTDGIVLTVSPDPIDFGELRTFDKTEMLVYLKNGSMADINISGISLENTSYFKFLDIPDLDNVLVLRSGRIDSFRIQFTPPMIEIGNYSTDLTIETSEIGRYSIPVLAKILYGTRIGGEISGVLSKENSPYIVINDLVVLSNNDLVIEPGVELKFNGPLNLTVGPTARLRAIGSENDSIRFSAVDPQKKWYGIWFNQTGNNDTLAYCVIREVREPGSMEQPYGSGAVFANYCTPTILNSRFVNNEVAVHLHNAVESDMDFVTISHCCFQQNDLSIFSFWSTLLTENSIFIHNTGLSFRFYLNQRYNKHCIMNNIVISQNNTSSSVIRVSGYGDDEEYLIIKNSIIFDNQPESGTLIESISTPIYIDYCNIDTSSENWFVGEDNVFYPEWPIGTYEWGKGNISQDPLFSNPDNGDFTLQDKSPCIDSGDPDPIYNDLEDPLKPGFALWPARGGLRNDMGAYGGSNYVMEMPEKYRIPDSFALMPNYPNPFNPSTKINYELPITNYVDLNIYNVLGQKVANLVSKTQKPGRYQVVWDGRNEQGVAVSSGIYFYVLETPNYFKAMKMILLR